MVHQLKLVDICRKHAIACYHTKTDEWSLIALRDFYYYQPTHHSIKEEIDLENIQWMTLKKHSKLIVEDGFMISFLPNCEHFYRIIIRNKKVKDENTQSNNQNNKVQNDLRSHSNENHTAISQNQNEESTTGEDFDLYIA